jgi:hypothetical protein
MFPKNIRFYPTKSQQHYLLALYSKLLSDNSKIKTAHQNGAAVLEFHLIKNRQEKLLMLTKFDK